jgi:arsenical pump membrane protein
MSRDLQVVISIWIFVLLFIFWGIAKNWHGPKKWTEPYILGSSLGLIFLFIYGIFSNGYITTGDILNVFYDKGKVLILILSFAFISISVDNSGFFDYCAKKIVIWSKGNGNKLFVFLFLLISMLTLVTSNDIVILTMTPIIIYICRNIGIKNMIPYLIAQFFAANILAMGLYIGSPTNIIIGDALKLTFVEYSKIMILPALFSCLLSLGILFLIFSRLSKNKFVSHFTPMSFRNLRFTLEMKFKVSLFVLLLISLSMTSIPQFKVQIWIVCLFFAFVTALFDLQIHWQKKNNYSLTLVDSLKRLPFGIVPFALCFFTIINVMQKTGLTDKLVLSSKNILLFFGDADSFITKIWTGVFTSTFSATLVNFLNDLPASVILGNVLSLIPTKLGIGNQLYQIMVSSSLIGVNPGCNMSMIGALAGLMWVNLLAKKKNPDEIVPTIRQLSLYGIPSMYLVVILTSIFVVFQSYVIKM